MSASVHGAPGVATVDRSPAMTRAGAFPVRVYVFALAFLGVCSAAAYFLWLGRAALYPYQFDYGEGIVLWQAAHVTNLAAAYHPITQYPYIVFHYPPLYHAASSLVASVFGADLLFAGRLVSLLSAFATCAALAWTVYRSAPRRAPRTAVIAGAVLAGALPCGLPTMEWARLMRVDMLGLALTFAGVALFVTARSSLPRYLAFVLFVAAVYTRQTLVAAPAACLVAAAVMNIRLGAKLAAFTVALGATVMAALMVATHGQVVRHLFLYNQNPFSVRRAISLIVQNVEVTLPVLALAAGSVFVAIVHGSGPRRLVPLRSRVSSSTCRRAAFVFAVYWILSGFVALTIGKKGSNINYLLEWNLVSCALAGLAVMFLLWRAPRPRRSPAAIVAYALPLLVMLQQTAAAARFVWPSADIREQEAAYARNSDAMVRILRASPEPVMSEDMTLLYRAHKEVPFEPAIVSLLAATGAWNERPLLDMIRNHAFSVMITGRGLAHSPWYSPAVSRAIAHSYIPVEQHGDFVVYRPAP